jgi:hypothetical protein
MTFTLLQTARKASRHLSSVLALSAAMSLGAGLVGVAPAQAKGRDEKDNATYTFKRVYKTGEADRYKLTTKMSIDNPQTGTPMDILMTMLMKDSTKEAKDDGASISVSEFESASINLNGMDIDISTMMPKVITTRDKNGKSEVKMEGGNEQVTSQMGDQMKQFTSFGAGFMPVKPIKVGDTWDIDPKAFATKDQKVTGKVTLVSVETIKGVKVAKMKSVMDLTDATNSKMHSESTNLIDVATGKALSLTSKVSGDTAGSKINIEIAMNVLGPDDKGNGKEAVIDSKKP